jgi:hypothetical protein
VLVRGDTIIAADLRFIEEMQATAATPADWKICRPLSPIPEQAWEAPRSGFVIDRGGSARRIASDGRSPPRLLAGKDLSDNHQLAFSPPDNSSTLLRRQTMRTCEV